MRSTTLAVLVSSCWVIACAPGERAEPAATKTAEAATPAPKKAAPEQPPAATDAPNQRPERDIARDKDRKPQEVMDFFGIASGMNVVELQTGKGYYAELLAGRVGEGGSVIAHNNTFVHERFAKGPLADRLERPQLARVEAKVSELDDPKLPAGVDAVLMILFYHDTYWQGVDRPKMNKAVFDALKPGGVFGIVDHHAEAGSGERDVKTLHRVDIELVKQEITAAGFVLDAESDLLRHPDDPRTGNVFAKDLRGKTDRFVLRFRKPKP